MKIRTLEIGRFGQFEHRKITLPATSPVIIYGENESGKSTLMHFLLYILFGFPQKSVLSRWSAAGEESLLGGSVIFSGDDGKTYRLERNFAENGTPQLFSENRDAGDIRPILGGIDRLLYQSVFCFDLEGLQGIERMKPEDLNDLLLGAGMAGGRKLSTLERDLEKRCGNLFKSHGKNPEINRLFHEMDTADTELKKWEKKLNAFLNLQKDIAGLQRKISELEKSKREQQQRSQSWTAFSAVKPLIVGVRALEKEIGRMESSSSFPVNGKERFDDLNKMIMTLVRDISDLNEQIHQLDESINAVSIRTIWFSEEGRLEALFRAAVTDEQNGRELNRLNAERRDVKTALGQVLRQLGPTWNENAVEAASFDIHFRRQLRAMAEQWQSNSKSRDQASETLKNQQETVGRLEERVRQLRDRLRSPHQEHEDGKSAKSKKGSRLLVFMAVPVLLLVLGFSILSGFFISPSAGLIFMLFGLLLGSVSLVIAIRLPLSGRGAGAGHTGADNDIRAELAYTEGQLAVARKNYGEKKEQAVTAINRAAAYERECGVWLEQHGYPSENPIWAEERSKLIGEAKKHLERLHALEAEISERQQACQRFEADRRELTEQLDLPEGDMTFLEKQFHLEKEKYNRIQTLRSQKEAYQKQRKHQEEKLQRLRKERNRLFAKAGVEDEEQFARVAAHAERRRELIRKKDERQLQMIEAAGSEENLHRYTAELDNGCWDRLSAEYFKDRIAEIDREIETAGRLLIDRQSERHSLEEDHTYRDLLDHYEALKAEADRKAGEWAVFRTALWALQRAKDAYRRQRLPKVLDQAQQYFRFITDGQYVSLRLDDSEGFIAERYDGGHFRADRLSRGTAEQLYLSLRLALTDTFSGREQLPLIVDEGFADFDSSRIRQTYSLLEEISRQRQVILFTCRPSVIGLGKKSQVLTLTRSESPNPSII